MSCPWGLLARAAGPIFIAMGGASNTISSFKSMYPKSTRIATVLFTTVGTGLIIYEGSKFLSYWNNAGEKIKFQTDISQQGNHQQVETPSPLIFPKITPKD